MLFCGKDSTAVASIVQDLINRLDGERQEKVEKKRPVIFVAHCLGGVV